mmetsp:Transcript_29584/g.53196  ORF Transcript_29584/g.53196 Transcript_29584/m.53196 type:complete len:88 (+) Transcript_29584:129-392(+)
MESRRTAFPSHYDLLSSIPRVSKMCPASFPLWMEDRSPSPFWFFRSLSYFCARRPEMGAALGRGAKSPDGVPSYSNETNGKILSFSP